MPKLINPEDRKILIAEAAWRIMLDQGIEGASVRNIAKEAGLSLGSLRYYFHSQEDLMTYSRELVSERISQRVDEIFTANKNPKEKIIEVLLALLPATGELKAETKIRLIHKTCALHEKEAFREEQDGVFLAIRSVMSNLLLLNLMKKELDLSIETERLYALMEGLSFDVVLRPDVLTAARAKNIVFYHLNAICNEEFR